MTDTQYPDATGWAGPGHARLGDTCPVCPGYLDPMPKLIPIPQPEGFSRLHCERCAAGSYGLHYPRPLTWRPIETAPRDGREVLLKVASRAGMPGKCLVGHYMRGGHCIEDHPPIDAGWYFWNGCMFDEAAKPIEWCELP